MEDQDFDNIVQQAVKEIPKEFLEKIENVSLITKNWPSQQQLNSLNKRGEGVLLFGLYQGIPQTKRRSYGIGGPLPDKITIFKMPILMISKTRNELIENVKKTVIHEIAHHFGLDEDAVRSAKKTRR